MAKALALPVEVYILRGDGPRSAWEPVPAELRFSLADPLAASLIFSPGTDEAIKWIFAFDLVYRVSVGWSTVGVGDVRFSLDPLGQDLVLLRLIAPNATSLFRLQLADVREFVRGVKALLDADEEDIVANALEKALSGILEG